MKYMAWEIPDTAEAVSVAEKFLQIVPGWQGEDLRFQQTDRGTLICSLTLGSPLGAEDFAEAAMSTLYTLSADG